MIKIKITFARKIIGADFNDRTSSVRITCKPEYAGPLTSREGPHT